MNEAEFVPPPVQQMNRSLDAFEKYLHQQNGYPPLIRLAFIHYQFEAIHPFLDGNGRIGRLMLALLMVNWNLMSLPLLYLSAFFEQHRQDYYDLLLAISERGAWRDWIKFFMRGVAEQSQDAIIRAKRLQEIQLRWKEQLTQTRTSALALRLVDYLFLSPVITIPHAQSILGVTYRSAQLNVEKLVSAGILKPAGKTPSGRIFWANLILKIIGGIPE